MRKVAIIIVLAAGAVGVLFWSQRRESPFFVSGLLEADEIRVGSRIGGRIAQVLVAEGDSVRAGQTLAVLEAFDLHERLAEARALLAARRALSEKLEAGYRPEEIAQAQARRDQYQAVVAKRKAGLRPLEIRILEDKLEAARAELVQAETEFNRIRNLSEQGRATQIEMDTATRALEVARARYNVARDELELGREGPRAEEIAEAAAQLAQAEAALALLTNGFREEERAEARANVQAAEASVAAIERQLAELSIVAPCDADVEAIDLQPGDLVAANAPVIALADRGTLWVRAYVPEDRLNLQIGQKVSIRVDSFPGRRFAGRVAFVSRTAEFTPANVQTPEARVKQMFRIKVSLEEGLDVLRAGMAADVLLEPPP